MTCIKTLYTVNPEMCNLANSENPDKMQPNDEVGKLFRQNNTFFLNTNPTPQYMYNML